MATQASRMPYLAPTERPRLVWPGGAKVALWVAVNLEYYEYRPQRVAVQDPWPRTPHPDVRSYSYRDYGNRVGFWRMLPMLDRYAVPCTASTNLAILHHFPEIAEEIVRRPWEVMSHGIYNTLLLTGMTEDEERQYYRDSIALVEGYTNQGLRGMLGPFFTSTDRTYDLMAEAGLVYTADWFVDDQPFPLSVRRGRLVAIPYSDQLNDLDGIYHRGHEAWHFVDTAIAQLDMLLRQGSESGRVMCIALHPFWFGQPHRISYLGRMLDILRSREGVWWTTAGEIADHYNSHYYEPVMQAVQERTRRLRGQHSR